MGRDRTQQATPDLFSTASFRDSSLPAKKQDSSAQKQRHVLPKDLSNAVKHLNDQELDLLAAACLEEAKRRGRLPRGQANRDESAPKWFSRTEKSSHRQHVEAATVSLTRGSLCRVRSRPSPVHVRTDTAFILTRSLRQKRKPRYTPVARGVARGDRLAQAIHSRFDDDERRRKARVCTHSWG
jgi:hypothetical protein